MDKDSKQVVVLLTHPNIKESRANKALMDAISDMGEVAIYNLYEMRMEDAFNAEIWSTIISHASALVFQFPFYWMSAPSLLKRWLDEVFTYLAKTPAVAGKTLMVVTTAGSEHDAYRSGGRNRFTVQFGIGSRNTVHHDTCDICPGIPGVTPFDDVISLRRNSGCQT